MAVQDVTEAELMVLQRLWEVESGTIRQLAEHLYPGGTTTHYATVQKLLERLEGKGFVRRDASGSPHLFWPAITREELLGRRLKTLAEKLTGGSLTPLLTHLVQSQRLSAQELEKLRSLIDEAGRRRK